MKTLELLTSVSNDILAIKELEGPARIEVERVLNEYIGAANNHLEEEHRLFIDGQRPIYEAIENAKGHSNADELPDYSVPFTPLADSPEVREFENIKHAYLYGLHAFGKSSSYIDTTPDHKYWSVTTIVRKHRRVEQTLSCNIDDSVRFNNNPYNGPIYDVAALNKKLRAQVEEMGLPVVEVKTNREMLDDIVEQALGDWIFANDDRLGGEIVHNIHVTEGKIEYQLTFLLLVNSVTGNFDRRSKLKVMIDNEVASSDSYLIARNMADVVTSFKKTLYDSTIK